MQQARVQKSHWGLIIIFGTALILALILIVAVGFLLYTRLAARAEVTAALVGTTALNNLDTSQVDPALALTSLGGVPESEVITEAIDRARPETALAALLYGPTLSNKESAGGFLQVATAYVERNQPGKATFCYQMAGTIATLAPDMSDTVRADLFQQTAEGLINIDEPALAKFYLDQSFALGLKSPYLQAAHRRRIFERLHKNYLTVDERVLARESLSLSANPPNLTLVTEQQTLLPGSSPIALTEEIQTAEANRWLAAQQLAADLVARGGNAPQTSIDQLTEALIIEDQLKLPFFRQESENTTQLSKKIDVTKAQINWLTIKYRIARRGYGLSLVPQWETQADQIRADLTKTYETLYALYADLVVALPEVAQIDKATEERLRSEILAGELGRYPNYPEEQRRAQLINATDQLIKTQPEINVFVGVGGVENKKLYTLIALD
ncbi:MAG: hypothetical protein FOGNACKC_05081 [Anaerolineae bacterium]|nr:hypothetical protein [Anaerolineae bacterium]